MFAGCAGNGPAAAGGDSPFDVIQSTIFDVSCLSAGCHNSSDHAGNLVLAAGQSYANLVNAPSFNTAALAAGLQRVVPNKPDQSFLLVKLNGPPAVEGSRMPLGSNPLSAAAVQSIQAWILAGAPGPSGPTATASPTPAPTDTETPLPSATSTPSATATPTATNTVPPTSTPTGTLPATATVTPTQPATATATVTPTPSTTATPSATATPSVAPTPTFSVDSTFPQIQATIFDTTCVSIGCHNATDKAGGNVLVAGQAYASLVGAVPQNPAAAAAGFLRVVRGNPDLSFLITKLTLPVAFDPQFGSRMPLGKPLLDPQQIDAIRAWILRGALPSE